MVCCFFYIVVNIFCIYKKLYSFHIIQNRKTQVFSSFFIYNQYIRLLMVVVISKIFFAFFYQNLLTSIAIYKK